MENVFPSQFHIYMYITGYTHLRFRKGKMNCSHAFLYALLFHINTENRNTLTLSYIILCFFLHAIHDKYLSQSSRSFHSWFAYHIQKTNAKIIVKIRWLTYSFFFSLVLNYTLHRQCVEKVASWNNNPRSKNYNWGWSHLMIVKYLINTQIYPIAQKLVSSK